MRISFVFALLGSLCAVMAHPLSSNISTTHVKRYYSVPQLPCSQGSCPWPIEVPDDENNGQGNKQPVRYCYKDQASYDNLQPFVDAAIQEWTTAMATVDPTALSFEIDTRSGPQSLCGDFPDGVVMDAVAVTYLGTDCDPNTSVGYDYDELDLMYRNFLDYCLIPGKSDAYNIASMTHELGTCLTRSHTKVIQADAR